jgi:hypothetical protein
LTTYPTADEVYYAIPPTGGISLTALKAKFQDRIEGQEKGRWLTLVGNASSSSKKMRIRKKSYKPTTSPPTHPPGTSEPRKPEQAANKSIASHWQNPDTQCRQPGCELTEVHDCVGWFEAEPEDDGC